MKQKILKSTWFISILLILVTFLLLSAFTNSSGFSSDEDEIFLKGRAIVNGLSLYTQIGSQHMPVMYYIAAFFALLGAESNGAFRLCFYALMALLWGLCYCRYSTKLNRRALILYPLIYITLLSRIEHGHTVLSEQFYGIAMAILLFELLIFQRSRTLRFGNCLMISLAVFLSFGSAFVAAFAVFAVWLTVMALDLHACRQEKRGFWGSIGHLIAKQWLLYVIVLLPLAGLAVYYIATDAWDSFLGWAYTLNRVIYPKYLPGGYGGNIVKSMLDGIGHVGSTLKFGAITTNSVVFMGMTLLAILFLVHQHKQRKDWILTGGLILFVITAATRGIFHFHGLPAAALLAAIAALYLAEVFPQIQQFCRQSTWKTGIVLFSACAFAASYIAVFPNIFSIKLDDTPDKGSLAAAIDTLTEPNERIGYGNTNYDILMSTDVFPATVTSGACAWLWEYGGTQAMEELEANPPRVYLFEPELAVWGYPIQDYAPELVSFINTNYTPLVSFGYPSLYVRNDYYWDAAQILDPELLFAFGDISQVFPLTQDITLSQTFSVSTETAIASLELMVGTYGKANDCTLEVVLIDETAGTSTPLAQVSCAGFADNAKTSISFPAQTLLEGHTYTLSFTSPDASAESFIAVYCSDELSFPEAYASYNGEPQDFDLCLRILKAQPTE